MNIKDCARRYYDAGLCVRPADAKQKFPIGPWKEFSERRPPTFEECWSGGDNANGIALMCGVVSGGVVCIDFDYEAYDYENWKALIPSDLFEKLYVEETQSHGVHVIYRMNDCTIRNQPLIKHYLPVEEGETSVKFKNKVIKVDCNGDAIITSTETRGNGGLVIVAPSAWIDDVGQTRSYQTFTPFDRDLSQICMLTSDEHQLILDACAKLSETDIIERCSREKKKDVCDEGDFRPSDYCRENKYGLMALHSAGWTDLYTNRQGYRMMMRPGQTNYGDVGGAYNEEDDGFFCFTTNAAPLEGGNGYTSFELFAIYEHFGDTTSAAEELGARMDLPGYREATEEEMKKFYEDIASVKPADNDIELTLLEQSQDSKYLLNFFRRALVADALLPFPRELMKTGTIIDKISSYIDARNPCIQPVASVAAGITFVGYLASRLFRTRFVGNYASPSVYSMLISATGTGKQAALDVLQELHELYVDNMLSQFGSDPENVDAGVTTMPASVQALNKTIEMFPKCLMLADEIGQTLKRFSSGRNGNTNERAIIDALLPLSTNCFNKRYRPPTTIQEVRENNVPCIAYPNLSIYSTGNGNDINSAFNEELLKKGFVNRLLLFWGDDHAKAKMWSPDTDYSQQVDVPVDVDIFIKRFAEYAMGKLNDKYPVLEDMPLTKEAELKLGTFMNNFNSCKQSLGLNELQEASIQRTIEKVIKLAIVFEVANSGPVTNGKVSANSMNLAIILGMYQIWNLLVSSQRFGESVCLKVQNDMFNYIVSRGGFVAKKSLVGNFSRIPKNIRNDALTTLIESGKIEEVMASGTKGKLYLKVIENESS